VLLIRGAWFGVGKMGYGRRFRGRTYCIGILGIRELERCIVKRVSLLRVASSTR